MRKEFSLILFDFPEFSAAFAWNERCQLLWEMREKLGEIGRWTRNAEMQLSQVAWKSQLMYKIL